MVTSFHPVRRFEVSCSCFPAHSSLSVVVVVVPDTVRVGGLMP